MAFKKEIWEVPNKNRTTVHSEYHMKNFSHSDTAAYLERINRKDIDPEKLYLELNRAVLTRDLMMSDILEFDRGSPQFNKTFKDDLVKIITYSKKLCNILGVDKNGEIETNHGQKALYSHTKKDNKKLNRKDNLHWALSCMALRTSFPSRVRKRADGSNPFGFPHFIERIKDIALDIEFLKVVAENIKNNLDDGKNIMGSDYQEGMSYGMTPEQWLIGRKLPQIYKEFFGRDLQFVRSRIESNELQGDGLDFLMWCLERVGISLSKETVTTYYYDHRIGPAS